METTLTGALVWFLRQALADHLSRQTVTASHVPIPPLPRGWSRICHEMGLFIQGIGLGIVVTSAAWAIVHALFNAL